MGEVKEKEGGGKGEGRLRLFIDLLSKLRKMNRN
jgi:hypothetical protein